MQYYGRNDHFSKPQRGLHCVAFQSIDYNERVYFPLSRRLCFRCGLFICLYLSVCEQKNSERNEQILIKVSGHVGPETEEIIMLK